MKFAIALSLLSVCVADVTLASQVLTIPPFDKADVDVAADRSSADSSVQHLRAKLVDGEINDQLTAGAALVQAGDEKSIARLVYAVRQGSPDAAEILLAHASIKVVPLLIEDIAHGDMSPIFDGRGDCPYGLGNVRNMAFQIVARTLAGQADLPKQTRAWFNELLEVSNSDKLIGRSKLLLEWWVHNEAAVQSGRLNEAVWTPSGPGLSAAGSENPFASKSSPLPPPPPPPKREGRQKQLSETFNVWVNRVADPARRNLSFTPIEAIQARTSATINATSTMLQSSVSSQSAPRTEPNSAVVADSANDSTPWSVIVVLIVAAIGLLWLKLKRRS